ncbi:aldehyde dehydrogenase family protein [Vagococcus elongatus]|uniref:Aldehyde dehydrogenase n=1 Tax=Vagococcus elongatus TaxID=180344 RepID=A0A430B5N4_9ENTE|nr:aldehyde dehydrogenase family protein [Vagococcus elongatus]RSU15623.1 hypothetical protein CBF29_00680 [Vagococcus elongatus]
MTDGQILLDTLEKQRNYFKSKKTFSLSFRLNQLKQLKKMFKENEERFLKALSKDLGKHPTESYVTEIGLIYHSIDYMLKHLPRWSKAQRVKTPLFLFPARSFTLASPYGNVLILSAFNYPLLLSIDPLIGAMSGGNTAMVALSEHTPYVNQVILEIYTKYFDTDYLYFFVSSKEKNTLILKEKFQKIFFTGSPKVGKIVYEAASRQLTPITLELGGKSPAIVTNHGKIKHAAKQIAWGKFLNSGQTCVAPDYCLVDARVADEFLTELVKAIEKMYGNNPEHSADYSRIIHEDALKRLIYIISQDQEYLLAGGKETASDKYLEPTVLAAPINTPLESMKEELFGPVLPVLIYENLTEAIDFIGQHEPPLAFYPFSENRAEISDLLKSCQFGGATVNDTILHLANIHLPFGGVGNSGIGHYHGKYSFETFTHQKAVLDRKTFVSLPLMIPPYTNMKEKIIRNFLR